MPKTREREGRRGAVARPRTISSPRLSPEEVAAGKELVDWMEHHRPRSREDCRDGPRPCPFVGCRYHLYLDVKPGSRAIKLNFPDRPPWEIPFTCALDIAEHGRQTLADVGAAINLTRERVRQVVRDAARRAGEDLH